MNSIRTKLLIIMVGLVAVPLAVTTILSAFNTRNEGIDNAREINVAQAHIVEQSILSVVDKNLQALESFASAPSTISFLEAGAQGELKDDIMNQMIHMDEELADGNSTIITGTDGMQILRTIGDPVDVADREYFAEAMKGNTFISDVQVSKSTGSRITTFAVPVWNAEHDKVIGMVQRNYNLSDFHDIIAEEVTEDRQELVIVDRDGMVVAHSGHEISADNPEDQSGNPFYTESRGTVLSGDYETTWQGDTWMVSWIKEPQTGWVVASCRVQSVALKHVDFMVAMMVGSGIVFIIIGVVVAFIIAQSIIRPLNTINESVGALADGYFNRITDHLNRKDELGVIIHDTNRVIDTLDGIVGNIKSSADMVNRSSEELADTASQISQTADNVSEAVSEIANGAMQQADEIQNANESTGIISDNIQAVSDNAMSVSGTAGNMSADSQSSASQMETLKASSDKMSAAIDEISEKIGSTEKAVERINEKVAAINTIASSTNLLALNASIEAARAGDAGRGFAVVAEEIGKLADESAASANEIRVEMEGLLTASREAVEKAGEVNEATEEQKRILEDTIMNITKLIDGIDQSVSGIASITSSAESCESSKIVIVDAMSSLSAISEENAAATQETSASMEELNAMVNNLSSSAASLKDVSNRLDEEMRFFKV
ncbi:MAG: methyl-accepting chemotaxis protein [Lachnospiraceae bacterium]|nr:methyl-accepting chemotaxis protein [Lachnospiraceae bacterium]